MTEHEQQALRLTKVLASGTVAKLRELYKNYMGEHKQLVIETLDEADAMIETSEDYQEIVQHMSLLVATLKKLYAIDTGDTLDEDKPVISFIRPPNVTLH